MDKLLPSLLALLVAFLIVIVELLTSHYPQTLFLVLKEKALYIYGAIYGLIAFFVMLAFDALVSSNTITIEGSESSSVYIRALLVGIAIKALLHINLVTVKVGGQSTPIGLETIVQLFEPTLLRTIQLSEFNSLRNFIKPYSVKFPNLEENKKTVIENIPKTFSDVEISALENDIEKSDDIIEVFELVVKNLGRKTLDRLFPLKA